MSAVIPFPGSSSRRLHERDEFWRAVENLAHALEGEGLEHGLDSLAGFIREHPEPSAKTAFEQYAAYHLIRSIVSSPVHHEPVDIPQTVGEVADWCLSRGIGLLSDKDIAFLRNMVTWRRELSAAQTEYLGGLFERLGGRLW